MRQYRLKRKENLELDGQWSRLGPVACVYYLVGSCRILPPLYREMRLSSLTITEHY